MSISPDRDLLLKVEYQEPEPTQADVQQGESTTNGTTTSAMPQMPPLIGGTSFFIFLI